MRKMLEAIRHNDGTVDEAAYYLQKYATAADVLGLVELSSGLREINAMLNESKEKLRKGIDETLRDEMAQAQQASVNILNAAMAGAKLQKEQE
jgi:hypothetical protein